MSACTECKFFIVNKAAHRNFCAKVVLTAHYGGENRAIQMGNSNSAEDILRLLAALKKML